ncbi:AMP-binding protein [Nitrogeniibacter mangrovi]|uniref:acetate--CoA ligase n=1 Tax=Nitrogeniibacter mangrovi TaxID=2016596 RepID=A0A6C1B442_9RHOO|nr:AMP-binding protein [Nitrogeniibacter mangrovi]QID18436.1 AMP-binding protein [Nitrogeniibacter mangrovi]
MPSHSVPRNTRDEPPAWQAAREALRGPGGQLRLTVPIDRQPAAAVALRVRGDDGALREIRYGELAGLSNRFAHVLQDLGVAPGDRVFVMFERVPEFPIAVLGTLKAGAVVAPLFAAFGPAPIRTRIRVGRGGVLVTTAALYRRKLAALRDTLPELRAVLLVAEAGEAIDVPGCEDLAARMAAAADTPVDVRTGADDRAWLHFTSGTTGTPKAVVHTHAVGINLLASARAVLELRAGDRYWCTADPGWVTGTAYGVLAPLMLGASCLIDTAGFDPQRWLDLLGEADVSVWYTTPTALRMLMHARAGEAAPLPLPRLRVAACVGEPLNPEVVEWGRQVLGRPVRDTWWQTETGAIMIAAADTPPGAMGRPLAGIEAHVVRRRAGGGIEHLDDRGAAQGELALEAGWPAMFCDYLGEPARYRDCFADGLYLTGDRVRRDADGVFWFIGRADDMIKSSGHLVGAFEVERVLMAHPAVAEAAAIGVPDATVGERIKAVVTLRPGAVAGEALATELRAHARRHLGAAIAPKEIAFAERLPHTRSGKIMRRLVKARELGLPAGDLSMLEDAPNENPR